MQQVLDFITNNQTLIITVILCVTYMLNKWINYLAAKPQQDIWDRVKPYSNAACALVFDGVEYLAKHKKMTSAAKSIEYAEVLKKFADIWNTDSCLAIAKLYAWYASAKKKSSQEEEITADSVAVE